MLPIKIIVKYDCKILIFEVKTSLGALDIFEMEKQ